MVKSELTDRLKQAIKESKKSQKRIAEEIGITPQALNKWLKDGKASKENLAAFAEATDTNFSWIILGELFRQEAGPPEFTYSSLDSLSPASQDLVRQIAEMEAMQEINEKQIAALSALVASFRENKLKPDAKEKLKALSTKR